MNVDNNNQQKPMGILIWGEAKLNGELSPVVFQLVSHARSLSAKLGGCWISVIIAGENIDIEKYRAELAQYGANELIVMDDKILGVYNTNNYTISVLQYIKAFPKEIFLIGATRQGRDLAPRISSELCAGLTADCTGLEINTDGKLAATRPTFGGELMATILSKTYPQMATVRPNVFEAIKIEPVSEVVLTHFLPKITEPSLKKVLQSIEINMDSDAIENAKIILVGGKGLKDKENFDKLYKLAGLLNAKVGATRKAVDAGLAPQSVQIGQTGKTVSPDLYIAFGVSGAVQHCVGISGAKNIIAVNIDPNSPIVKVADKTIIADAVSVLDEWLSLF